MKDHVAKPDGEEGKLPGQHDHVKVVHPIPSRKRECQSLKRALAFSLRRVSSLLLISFPDPNSLPRHRFDSLVFRPVDPSERARWDEEMRTRHHFHGKVKRLFARPLRKAARVPVKTLPHQDIQALLTDLSRMTDPRKRRGIHHSRPSLVATFVCALLCGASHTLPMDQGAGLSNSLKKRLGYRRHPGTNLPVAPSEPTLQSIDLKEVVREDD